MSRLFCASFAALSAIAVSSDFAYAQSTTPLPQITVQGTADQPRAGQAGPPASLTVPTTEQARTEIERTPGAVEVVPDTAFKTGNAVTIKDALDYVPGVFAQPKWGDDTRLSIRGSGLSRNFHLRGVQLYMDGIPINTSDGYGDFQEIDPTAYRYIEVLKGGNALKLGGNSLGGAVNFVMPTGRDAKMFDGRVDGGSFGYGRVQASTAGVKGPFDYYITGSAQKQDGYREHSDGHSERFSGNFGYQFSPVFETRFYLNVNNVRQRIPGEVTRDSAIYSPRTAATNNVVNDWQRNINTVRIANKSTVKFDNTVVDFGAFYVDRHLMHPIFQWLDHNFKDYGTFARAVDERYLWGYKNRFTVGFNMINGTNNATQNDNVGGFKGALQSSLVQTGENYSIYGEDSFYVLPNVALVGAAQQTIAIRSQQVNFSLNGDVPGRSAYNLFSPKGGIVWDVDKTWQVFGNVSRSAEAPSFGESVAPEFFTPGFPTIPFFNIKAQTATTYEIGTRGRRPDYTWDMAIYRANIRNELQCFYSSFGNCNVTNADRTYHEGVEAGFGVTLLKNMFVRGNDADRLWLNLAYTYSHFRYDNDVTFGNNQLPGAPPHYLRTELLYKHPSGFSFGPNVEWVPAAYYVDSANTLGTASYMLWGLKAAYDDGGKFSAYIEGRNLGDKSYIAATSIIDRANAGSALFNPGTGMAFYAGMRIKM